MFAPLPRTQQLHRTYTSQTTSKKNVNKENNLPSKTPSRAGPGPSTLKMGVPGTSVRIGLGGGGGLGTVGRDNNVSTRVEGGKGKGKEGDEIAPKRLFQNAPIQSSKSFSSLTHIPTKTPLPAKTIQSLRTPAPSRVLADIPAPTPLPSASKPRRKSRQSFSSTPLRAVGEDSNGYVTPGGWDEGESLESIGEELDLGNGLGARVSISGGLDELAEEEDDWEMEYMPPKYEEPPWEPLDPHPNTTNLLTNLSKIPPTYLASLSSRREYVYIDPDVESFESERIKLGDDEEIEEPLFRGFKPPKRVVDKTSAQPSSRAPVSALKKPIPTTLNRASKQSTLASGPVGARPPIHHGVQPQAKTRPPIDGGPKTTTPSMRRPLQPLSKTVNQIIPAVTEQSGKMKSVETGFDFGDVGSGGDEFAFEIDV